MHEYDVALKLLLHSAKVAARELTSGVVKKWLNVELPEVRNTRVDLLGETADDALVHIELQSTNDPTMPLRMLEYYLRVFRRFGRFPRQTLLYVGEAPLRLESELRSEDLWYRYRLMDIRDLDGERLLGSDQIGDNILAILTRLPDLHGAVRQVMKKIVSLTPPERQNALRQMLLLSGLRHLGQTVEEEARRMPILNDILDHEVLGREYKRGIEEGERVGRKAGELALVRLQIQKRFGTIPAWAETRLAAKSTTELVEIGVRLLDAASLNDLLE